MANQTNLQSVSANPAAAEKRSRLSSGIERYGLSWVDAVFFIIMLFSSVSYFAGIQAVPFHPDESTQIFMSADVDLFFTRPQQIAWQPNPPDALRQWYRELDAPLTRDLIGIARWIGGLKPLPADWNWSQGWAENAQGGALPAADLLLASRLGVAWLFPFSLVLIYLACRQADHRPAGLIAAALLSVHPLILLHTRRAMAESSLLFASALLIWAFSARKVRPWVVGAFCALALNAKQSVLGLIPAAWIGSILATDSKPIRLRKSVVKLAEILASLGIVFILLNPYLWLNPVAAARSALADRQDLLSRQTADYRGQYPGGSPTLSTQALVVLGQLYIAPLQFEEVGNYSPEIQTQKLAYLSNPLNNLVQGPLWGSLLLFFTLLGMLISLLRFRTIAHSNRLWLGLLFLSTVVEFIVIVVGLPLPFQRYVIPLVPLICIWSGLGVEGLIRLFTDRKQA